MSKASGRLTGNVGEFSEPYVVAKLLVDGQVPVINSMGEKSGAFISIRGVKRIERNREVVYIQRENQDYSCMVNDAELPPNGYSTLHDLSVSLLSEIKSIDKEPERKVTKQTFYCPSAEALISALSFSALKAKSDEKSDITLRIADSFSVNGVREAGFTIKSRLGSAPSLANAGATVFKYNVTCQTLSTLDDPAIADLTGKALIRKLIALPGFKYDFLGVANEVYGQNLRMIDSLFAPMVAAALFHSYHVVGGHFSEIIEDDRFVVKLNEICGFHENLRFFVHKFKDFLKQSALGMQPKTPWNGSNEVTGGALIVQPDGQVVCLCTDKDTDFRDYLFDNCRFETPSSGVGDNKLCALRKDAAGNYWIHLSLQIRFK